MSRSQRVSAGLLLFRRVNGTDGASPSTDATEVLIGHMGGPYWAKKTQGAWSIPKGQIEAGETSIDTALREFEEETGVAAPPQSRVDAVNLGTVKHASGKTVEVWALQSDIDLTHATPGLFDMEWPPRSGRMVSFPEMDVVRWVPVAEARMLLIAAQRAFLDRLPTHSAAAGSPPVSDPQHNAR